MTTATQFQRESARLTTPSTSPVIRRFVRDPETATDGNVCRIEAEVVFAPIPVGYSEIDSLIGEYETDAKRAAALVRARKRMSKAVEQDNLATVASLRLRKGLSQTALASLIGTSQSRLSRIESGLDDIMHTTFEKLIVALEVTRDQLAGALAHSERIQQ